MHNSVRQIVNRICSICSSTQEVNKAYLFGSQLKRYNDKSDIDVLIVLESDSKKEMLLKKLCALTMEEGKLIHPVILNEEEYESRKDIEEYRTNIFSNAKVIYSR